MSDTTQKMKLSDQLRYFYIKNIRFRLIRLYAYLKHLHRSSSGFELSSDISKKDINTAEMDLTMSILRDNIHSYFETNDDNDKTEIFYNLIESVQHTK